MTHRPSSNRREFLRGAAAAAAAALATPYVFSSSRALAVEDGPVLRGGLIGAGGRGTGVAFGAVSAGAKIVAVADVDKTRADKRAKDFSAKAYNDYHDLLNQKDLDFVIIGTPDHWHTANAIDAMDAGKDVYLEKPMTLTVAEGQQLIAAHKRTGRVLQIGTQQRSTVPLFARAVATVQSGQLGKIREVRVKLPDSTPKGGPFATKPVPSGLDWDRWLGQTPKVDYVPERCHFNFRWWYDYSGGIVTDWGAHHLDIVQWALGFDHTGPTHIDGSKTKLPTIVGGYTTPAEPIFKLTYPGGIVVSVTSGDEGIEFFGDKGSLYVNRKKIKGPVIEAQDADAQLRDSTADAVRKLYGGNFVGDQMRNFFGAIRSDGKLPVISDVVSQHRSASACHLANISIRLQKPLTWDPKAEEFPASEVKASEMLSRKQREPYVIQG